MALKTRNFMGVEILAPGTWNGITGTVTFSDSDLDDIILAYAEQKGRISIPIKIGHNERQKLLDDMPSAGWVENVRKVGTNIVADFLKVPDKLADLIDVGSFRGRSVELNENFEVNGKKWPLVLSAVALLGESLPAVETLADIIKLFEREHLESNSYISLSGKGVSLSEDEEFAALMVELDNWFGSSERFFKTKPGAPTLRSIHRVFKENLTRIHKGVTRMSMKPETLKLLGLSEDATDEEIEAALTAKITPKAAEPEVPAVMSDETKTELGKADARILTLEKQIALGVATAAVDSAITVGKLLPVQRETALKMAVRDMGEFSSFIETQPSMLEFGERGTSAENNVAKFEPTPLEVATAKQLGAWTPEHRVALMRHKASVAGVELPVDFK